MNRFRVIVQAPKESPAPGSALAESAALVYVSRIVRRRASGDPYRATDYTADRLLAMTFTYNVALAVSRRNHGIIETA